MTDRYKAAANMVRVENLGRHVEVWIEEAEGGIKAFYIGGDYVMYDSWEDFMNGTTKS